MIMKPTFCTLIWLKLRRSVRRPVRYLANLLTNNSAIKIHVIPPNAITIVSLFLSGCHAYQVWLYYINQLKNAKNRTLFIDSYLLYSL